MAFEDKYIASRYHVENQIGEGGMSIVYKAKDIVTGKDVAIKILKEDTLKILQILKDSIEKLELQLH